MDKVEWTEPEAGIAALGQIPVAGASAVITLAYLPSCAKKYVTLNFHLDFKSTSSETISVRPHIYLIGLYDHAFSPKELAPGQSYSAKYGHYWLGAAQTYEDFGRVEAAIEVYTPEGWVEVDRAVGEPFEWMTSLPLPVARNIRAPESAEPGERRSFLFEIYNPGFTNPPACTYTIDDIEYPESGWYWLPPDHSLDWLAYFTMGEEDKTIIITPYRFDATGAKHAGQPVAFTVLTTLPHYHLAISINGEGSVLPEDVAGDYPEGTVIELTAYPASGWYFHSWEDTDNNALNPTTVTMDSDRHVVCNFTQEAPAGCLPVIAAGAILLAIIIASIILLV